MTRVNSKIMFILRAGIICDYGAILVQCGPSSNPTSHMWVESSVFIHNLWIFGYSV